MLVAFLTHLVHGYFFHENIEIFFFLHYYNVSGGWAYITRQRLIGDVVYVDFSNYRVNSCGKPHVSNGGKIRYVSRILSSRSCSVHTQLNGITRYVSDSRTNDFRFLHAYVTVCKLWIFVPPMKKKINKQSKTTRARPRLQYLTFYVSIRFHVLCAKRSCIFIYFFFFPPPYWFFGRPRAQKRYPRRPVVAERFRQCDRRRRR